MSGRKKRKMSLGTGLTLLLTFAVLASTGFVLLRLGSGHTADLSRLDARVISLNTESTPDPREKPETARTEAPDQRETRQEPPEKTEDRTQPKSAGLTFGGTIAIEENIRKSGYISDTRKYDFSDIFMLLSPEIQGRTAGAFLENLIMENAKVSSTVIPPAAAEMMQASGFSLSFSGFAKAWDKGADGIRETKEALRGCGVEALGILPEGETRRYSLREVNGIRIAFAQYTATLSAGTRKAMQKKGQEGAIPEADPELIAADITAARQENAQAVVVLLNWGKTGGKTPEKAQMILAQQIADLGADLIIGSGSRVPQKVEYLLSADGRKVLCAYSLGTLISDHRKSANRMGGFLLHVQLEVSAEQELTLGKVSYTPTYAWKFRQDGKDYYRVVAADRSAPDGMAADQIRQMQKTLSAVQEALAGAPVEIR